MRLRILLSQSTAGNLESVTPWGRCGLITFRSLRENEALKHMSSLFFFFL